MKWYRLRKSYKPYNFKEGRYFFIIDKAINFYVKYYDCTLKLLSLSSQKLGFFGKNDKLSNIYVYNRQKSKPRFEKNDKLTYVTVFDYLENW